jgi:hypothetical protein
LQNIPIDRDRILHAWISEATERSFPLRLIGTFASREGLRCEAQEGRESREI